MEEKSKVLGILGGLGPMSTVYFYEMIVSLTKAACDQEHIDLYISSRATTPDRTDFIVGASRENPVKVMAAEAKKLQNIGADMIAIPCNTAHYFYKEIADAVDIPVLNIIEETVRRVKKSGAKKMAILATEGTIQTHTYQAECERQGVASAIPSPKGQKSLMDIIYKEIKAGKPANMVAFMQVVEEMKEKGCDCAVLGCTELSLLKKEHGLGDFFIDSLETLALAAIAACGKEQSMAVETAVL